jgi:hypothetical protein
MHKERCTHAPFPAVLGTVPPLLDRGLWRRVKTPTKCNTEENDHHLLIGIGDEVEHLAPSGW